MRKPELKKLLDRKRGVLLDVSLGGKKQARSLSLLADVGHDPRTLPFPLPDACVHTAVVTHVVEFLDPSRLYAWFDELWRVMQPEGTVYMSGPYGGDQSDGWLSDPTHRTRIIESTFLWLDPRGPLYATEHANRNRPTPKPWLPQAIARVPGSQGTISYNAVLMKVVPEKRKKVAA